MTTKAQTCYYPLLISIYRNRLNNTSPGILSVTFASKSIAIVGYALSRNKLSSIDITHNQASCNIKRLNRKIGAENNIE
jgi:hypothetical protein